MRSARAVAVAVAVAVGLALACGLPPGWDEVEDAEDEVEEPWMTLLNQCSTVAWAWYGVEEAIRPCRRSEPSSSEADEVSARGGGDRAAVSVTENKIGEGGRGGRSKWTERKKDRNLKTKENMYTLMGGDATGSFDANSPRALPFMSWSFMSKFC